MRKFETNDITVYIGSFYEAKQAETDEFDEIINVSKQLIPNTSEENHYPLSDGANDFADFKAAVEAVKNAIDTSKTVLVHCMVGVSRSVTVTATAITSLQTDAIFEDILYQCQNNSISPNKELISLAKQYLPEEKTQSKPFKNR